MFIGGFGGVSPARTHTYLQGVDDVVHAQRRHSVRASGLPVRSRPSSRALASIRSGQGAPPFDSLSTPYVFTVDQGAVIAVSNGDLQFTAPPSHLNSGSGITIGTCMAGDVCSSCSARNSILTAPWRSAAAAVTFRVISTSAPNTSRWMCRMSMSSGPMWCRPAWSYRTDCCSTKTC